MKVYLDNCCFNRPYDDQSQLRISIEAQAKLFVQDKIRNGELELVTSYILRYENANNPYSIRKNAIERFIAHHTAQYISFEQAEQCKDRIAQIEATGVKPKDARHVACAICAGCDYFLTTDDRLLKYQTEEIRICNPIDFVSETEEET